MISRLFRWLLIALVLLIVVVAALIGVAVSTTYPRLPSIEALTEYRPKIPLRRLHHQMKMIPQQT